MGAGELEESKALLDATIRGQRQVEQELSDSREQMNDMQSANASLGNQKRKMENDIQQMQADLDNLLGNSKAAEEKAKKAMVDAGRLADELRAEQDHFTAQEKAVKTTGKVLDDLSHRAEDASIQATLGAQQLPVKLEGRAREIELELTRTVQTTAEFHKTITKGERRVKELMFQTDENKNNQDRITELWTNCNKRSSLTRSRLRRLKKLLPSTWQSIARHNRNLRRLSNAAAWPRTMSTRFARPRRVHWFEYKKESTTNKIQ